MVDKNLLYTIAKNSPKTLQNSLKSPTTRSFLGKWANRILWPIVIAEFAGNLYKDRGEEPLQEIKTDLDVVNSFYNFENTSQTIKDFLPYLAIQARREGIGEVGLENVLTVNLGSNTQNRRSNLDVSGVNLNCHSLIDVNNTVPFGQNLNLTDKVNFSGIKRVKQIVDGSLPWVGNASFSNLVYQNLRRRFAKTIHELKSEEQSLEDYIVDLHNQTKTSDNFEFRSHFLKGMGHKRRFLPPYDWITKKVESYLKPESEETNMEALRKNMSEAFLNYSFMKKQVPYLKEFDLEALTGTQLLIEPNNQISQTPIRSLEETLINFEQQYGVDLQSDGLKPSIDRANATKEALIAFYDDKLKNSQDIDLDSKDLRVLGVYAMGNESFNHALLREYAPEYAPAGFINKGIHSFRERTSKYQNVSQLEDKAKDFIIQQRETGELLRKVSRAEQNTYLVETTLKQETDYLSKLLNKQITNPIAQNAQNQA